MNGFLPAVSVTGMTRPKNQFDETAYINILTYLDYYKRLRLLALSAFEWENLPDSCNAEFLERTLYEMGKAAFLYDDELGIINTKCTPSERVNIYNIATEYHCYATNYDTTLPIDKIVLIRNNIDYLPTDPTIQLFARRLYEAERAADVNIKGQKTPVLIVADETQRLTMKNVYMNYDGNIPVIYANKNFDVNSVKTFPTVAPFVADKIQTYKRNVWNEFLTFLGVNNVETEKRERLTNDEVNANNNVVNLSADTMLLTREKAAAEFNKMWGANVSVKRRTFDDIQNAVGAVSESEDGENG